MQTGLIPMRSLRFFTTLSNHRGTVPARSCIILILTMLLFSDPARAEMIKGEIISLQHQENTVTLHLKQHDTDEQPLKIEATTPLPDCVQEGNIVRVWGDFSTDKTTFIATDVRGSGPRFSTDSTGVRSRLHHYNVAGKSFDHQTRHPARRHSSSRRNHRR